MPLFTATRLQLATYLLGVCPFSIAFLVFLNSSLSFVLTDLLGREHGVGDAVGNLGFADELVALVACPFWGLLSDRIGVRTVCVIGYAIIALSLVLFVQAKNVYPQLLLGRLFFSVGGAAASTMVSAVLPAMSYVEQSDSTAEPPSPSRSNGHAATASIASTITMTPARFQAQSQAQGQAPKPKAVEADPDFDTKASTSRIAGFVGMFTGLGALIALFVFLPLPVSFQKHGVQPGRAIQYTYYVAAAVAAVLSVVCLIGLRNLKSDLKKGRKSSWTDNLGSDSQHNYRAAFGNVVQSLLQAFSLGLKVPDIGVGYVGGFVARASSVAISSFIPLLVNAMFTSSGLCVVHDPTDKPVGLPDIKRECPQAYIVAAELTGVSQTIGLIAAPFFGYWYARTTRKTIPLATSAFAGLVGYPLFAAYFDPDASNKGARVIAFVAASLIGFSQIGAIVCSLASLGSGVLGGTTKPKSHVVSAMNAQPSEQDSEEAGLLGGLKQKPLAELKGSIAGVYSFFGGAAILILTKAGGAMFDNVSRSSPFFIMAAFNLLLLIASITVAIYKTRSAITT